MSENNERIANITDANSGIQKHRRPNRVGRGPGSGAGKTAARGMNGQGSRAGFSLSAAFEGGQMPVARRIPKRGFNNKRFADKVSSVTLQLSAANVNPADEVTPELLRAKGIVAARDGYVKVIGNDELPGAYTVKAHSVSKGAQAAIEKAGGKVEILPRKKPVVKNKMRTKVKKA